MISKTNSALSPETSAEPSGVGQPGGRGPGRCPDMSLGKPREMVMDRGPGMLQSMGSQRVEHNLVTEQQANHIHNQYID